MKLNRRHTLAALSAALVAATATGLGTASTSALAHDDEADEGYRSSKVFTSSNAPTGNQLLVYANGRAGLALVATLATGGLGSGVGLGSQGAVTLSGDGRHLYVVNPGSHSVSTFRVSDSGLRLLSVTASGGLDPISVTENEGVVYVLNDGGAGNVAGFRNAGGELRPIAGGVRGLSVAGGAAPAQVGFSTDGEALVVSQKGTNTLTTYRVARDGSIAAPSAYASPGLTPFGFAFNRRNQLVVTEAVGGAVGASTVSSYRFAEAAPSTPAVVSASVPDTQTAACWVSTTPDGRYAFVSNTGSSTVSSYRVGGGGQIALANAAAGQTGAGSAPADNAVSPDGRYLFVRNGRTGTIASFAIADGGSLVARPLLTGLPATAVGLAAN